MFFFCYTVARQKDKIKVTRKFSSNCEEITNYTIMRLLSLQAETHVNWVADSLQLKFDSSEFQLFSALGAIFILRKGFLNHAPTYVRTLQLHKVRKNCHFLDHPPTPMSLRNIKMAPKAMLRRKINKAESTQKKAQCHLNTRTKNYERSFLVSKYGEQFCV